MESILESTLLGLAEGVMVFEASGRVLLCNPAAERILGLTERDIHRLRQKLSDWRPIRLDGSPYPVDELPVSRCLRTGVAVREVLLGNIRPDGRVTWLQINAEPLRSAAEGCVPMAIVSFVDVTRCLNNQREKELKGMALDAAGEGIALLERGRILRANQALAHMVGYPSAESLNQKRWQSFFRPGGRRQVAQLVPSAYPAVGGWRGLVEVRRADGSMLPVNLSLRWLDATHQVCVCSDFSEEVAARERAAKLNADLETTNAQLRRSTAQLEKIVRLKDEFLANMSHELRTPLSAVLGMAEVLLEGVHGPLSAKQRRCTEVILDSGQHLLSLVNDVLDLAKIGADRLELNWQAVSAAAACRAALSLVAPAAQRKHVELVMHLPAQDPVLRADERRLRQVLVNLLSNAVKFTPEQGRVSLILTAEPDGSGVQFAVADTGAGIRPEDLPRLFQPFVQLAHDPDQVAGGAGLGLVLVRQMVELHGGYVTVQSTLGKGTCFTVHLPCGNLSGLPGGSTGPVLRPAATVPAPSTDARPRRVLVVDDNESNLELLVDYLSAKGWCVESARSGAEALDCAAARPPDIVLMDIQMPKMTGMEAIQRLRETATGSATPVIAITALAMIGDRERCLAAGATSYLSKPISPAAVDAEMRRCLA